MNGYRLNFQEKENTEPVYFFAQTDTDAFKKVGPGFSELTGTINKNLFLFSGGKSIEKLENGKWIEIFPENKEKIEGPEEISLVSVKKDIIDKMEDAKTREFINEKTQVNLSRVELSVIIMAVVRYK